MLSLAMKRELYLLCVGLLFGCGEEESERTRAEFCADWAAAACSKETLSACQAANESACQDTQTAECLKLVPAGFSDAKGDACIDAVRAAYEDGDLRDEELGVVFKLAGPCALIVKGPGAVGDDCDDDSDCNAPDGLSCVKKTTDEEGTCQKPVIVAAGRDCSEAAQVCADGFYCNGENCVEAKASGRDCSSQEECASGLFCSEEGECQAGREVSASCESDVECESGICLGDDDEKTCTDRIVLARSEPICDTLR